jgi:hypothetical protein
MGNRTLYPLALARLADVLRASGNFERARHLALKSLAVNQEIGNNRRAAESLSVLCETAWNIADYTTAKREAEECIALLIESGLGQTQASPRLILGRVACSLGDYPLAKRHFCAIMEPHLKVINNPNAFWRMADAFVGMADVLMYEGKPIQAAELLDHVLHRHCWQETKEQAQVLIAMLRAANPDLVMPPSRELQTVLVELLSEDNNL